MPQVETVERKALGQHWMVEAQPQVQQNPPQCVVQSLKDGRGLGNIGLVPLGG